MPTTPESNWNFENVTDEEVYAAIHYLEPDPRSAEEQNDDNSVVICVCLYIVLLGCLVFLWLYWR